MNTVVLTVLLTAEEKKKYALVKKKYLIINGFMAVKDIFTCQTIFTLLRILCQVTNNWYFICRDIVYEQKY